MRNNELNDSQLDKDVDSEDDPDTIYFGNQIEIESQEELKTIYFQLARNGNPDAQELGNLFHTLLWMISDITLFEKSVLAEEKNYQQILQTVVASLENITHDFLAKEYLQQMERQSNQD